MKTPNPWCRPLVGSLVLAAFAPQAQALQSYTYFDHSPMRIGRSYDPMDLMAEKRDCLTSSETERVETGVPSTLFKSSLVRSGRDLYEKMDMDAKISAQASFWGFTLGSTSFERTFNTEERFKESSVTWAIMASSNYGVYKLKETPSLDLRPFARELIERGDYESFAEQCGTEYIKSAVKEVRLVALFTAYGLDRDTAEHLRRSFSTSGGYGPFSASANVDYENWTRETLSEARVTMTIFAQGGAGVTQLAQLALNNPSVDSLKSVLSQYMATMSADNAVPTELFRASMSTFGWRPQGARLNALELDAWDARISEILYLYQDLTEASRRSSRIAEDAHYGEADRNAMRAQHAQLQELVQKVLVAVQNCRANPRDCRYPSEVQIPRLSWPAEAAELRAPQWKPVRLYRYLSVGADHAYHRYTTEPSLGAAWTPETSVGFILAEPYPGTVPLYRLRSTRTLGEMLTISAATVERAAGQYRLVRIEGYVFDHRVAGMVPLHEYPCQDSSMESFYTNNREELGDGGFCWVYGGVAAYILPNAATPAPRL